MSPLKTARDLILGSNGEPKIVVWAVRIAAVLGALALLQTFLTSTTILVVRWGARPMLEEQSVAQAKRDSAIVAQLGGQIGAVAWRQQIMAEGLKYPYGSPERSRYLDLMQGIPVPTPVMQPRVPQ